MGKNGSLTYADSGVNIDTGNQVVSAIKSIIKDTHNDSVLSNIGGFGGLYELQTRDYSRPILVSSTDGVGTKVKLAQELGMNHLIGIDLVAMCVNDVIVQGAKPLFFLDYYATSKLDVATASQILLGIANGCKESSMALIGGETAEMPGVYKSGDFDLAGFCVGVVDFNDIIDGSNIQKDNLVIGISSSGPHSNGYSLIRKIIAMQQSDLQGKFGNTTLGDALIEPTKIYVRAILNLLERFTINGMAHITGGGFKDNIARILPNNCDVIIKTNTWEQPEIFRWIQSQGNISADEMLRTFNCGIGMVLIIEQNDLN
ncbi:MAG: phosphoribosylformylglycinamidine cyclo-ligase, partial [Gammaproteobacteria bacterium]